MNLKEIIDWSSSEMKKDNQAFVLGGVNDKNIQKVKCALKGIIDRCNIIINNTSKNNRHMNEIQEFMGQLTKAGLKIPGSAPTPAPSVLSKNEK